MFPEMNPALAAREALLLAADEAAENREDEAPLPQAVIVDEQKAEAAAALFALLELPF